MPRMTLLWKRAIMCRGYLPSADRFPVRWAFSITFPVIANMSSRICSTVLTQFSQSTSRAPSSLTLKLRECRTARFDLSSSLAIASVALCKSRVTSVKAFCKTVTDLFWSAILSALKLIDLVKSVTRLSMSVSFFFQSSPD